MCFWRALGQSAQAEQDTLILCSKQESVSLFTTNLGAIDFKQDLVTESRDICDHIIGCKHMLPLRTKLWHDPLVQMWHQLAKISGQSCGSEVTNLMVNSTKRADVVLYKDLYNVLTDVRTIAGGDQRYCCAAALSPGYGAERRRLACSGSEPGGHFYRPLPRGRGARWPWLRGLP